ncbi:LapA family protein [bacterium]|nr:LapA family protein [bacterium]
MWIIRWILGAVLIILILGFALQNQEQTATVQLLKWQSPNMPLYLYLYFAFGIGLLFWSLVSAFNIFKLRGQLGKTERENKRLRKELDLLRNAELDDDLPVPALSPPEPETEV